MQSLGTLVIAVLCFAGVSLAQSPTPEDAKLRTESAAPTNSAFAKELAARGVTEVELGRLASDRATSGDVQMFARMMVQDHTANNSKLRALADKKGIMVPSNATREGAAIRSKLESLSGDQFDLEYMKSQVEGHEAVEQLLQQQIDSGNDAELKAFAEETLPKVQQHLELARKLRGQGGNQSTSPSNESSSNSSTATNSSSTRQ